MANDIQTADHIAWDDRLGAYDGRQLTLEQMKKARLNRNNDGLAEIYRCPADGRVPATNTAENPAAMLRSYAPTYSGGPAASGKASENPFLCGVVTPSNVSGSPSTAWAQRFSRIRNLGRTCMLFEYMPANNTLIGDYNNNAVHARSLRNLYVNKNTTQWGHSSVGTMNWLFADVSAKTAHVEESVVHAQYVSTFMDTKINDYTANMTGSWWDAWSAE